MRRPSPASCLFPCADAIASFDWYDEDAAVANLARARGLDDGCNHIVDDLIRDDDLDFHLWQEGDVVLLASIDGRVALLFAVAADLGDGHSRNTQLRQCVSHIVDLVRPNDTFNELHLGPPGGAADLPSTRGSPVRTAWLR